MQAVQYRNTMASAQPKPKVDDGWRTFTIEDSRREKREMMRAEQIRRDREAKEQIAKILDQYRIIDVVAGTVRRPASEIIKEVAIRHRVRATEITGASRSKRITAARHEAMWEVRRQRADLSLPVIGRIFGGRDHTTVLHAVTKIEAQRTALRGAER